MAAACVSCGSNALDTHFELLVSTVVRCETCGLVFKSSLLEDETRAGIEALYNAAEYWQNPQRAAEGVDYDPDHPRVRLYRRTIEALLAALPGKGRLLDVGCAKGVFLDVARRDGWHTAGLEISTWAAQYAREQFGLEVFAGSLEEAPWPDGSFDVITMLDLIEHLTNPARAIARVSRLLASGGLLVIETPNASSLAHRAAEALFKLSGRQVAWPLLQIYGMGKGGHVSFFSEESLGYLLTLNGLRVERTAFDALGQALWRSMTPVERLMGPIDELVGGLGGGKYHMMVFARKAG